MWKIAGDGTYMYVDCQLQLVTWIPVRPLEHRECLADAQVPQMQNRRG